jgi:CubicO group peptidase (beta-lactamase class C family)
LILLFGSPALRAQKIDTSAYSQLIGDYRELIRSEIIKNKIAGLSIALVDKNGIIWAQGFGFENIEDSVKATENSLYGLGSISKLFTATGIMQMEERHRISIDKPVSNYVPEFNMKSIYGTINTITTRLLLSHHAGFPSDLFGSESAKESYKNLIPYLNREYTAFPSGYLRCYSNLGFCFLGYELDKLSKLNYDEYINRNIFTPLGMNNSLITSDPSQNGKICKTYDGELKQTDEPYIMNTPAGGIFSNVTDMALFIQSWLTDKSTLLREETIQNMFTPQCTNVKFNLGQEYGLGWELKRSDYDYRAEHGGALHFFRSQIAVNRYAGLGVIILCNSANGGAISWRASEILDKACACKKVEEKKLAPFVIDNLIQKQINLADYTGNYGQNLSWFPLKESNHSLVGKPGNDSMAFKLQADGYFGLAVKQADAWVDIPGQQFLFTELGGEKVFLARQWGTWVVAAKMYPEQQITPEWQKRIGKYKVINCSGSRMFSKAELSIAENTIFLSAITPFSDQPMCLPLDLKNETLATVLGTSTYSGSTLQVIKNDGEELIYFMGLKMVREM